MKKALLALYLLTVSLICTAGFWNFIPLTSSEVVAGYVSWYDASDSLTYDGGGLITNWADKGSNNFDCAGPSGKEPTRTAAGLNGHDVATFNTDKYLECGATALIDTTSAFTLEIIAKETSGGSGLFFIKGASTNFNIYDNAGAGDQFRIVNPNWGFDFTGEPGLDAYFKLQFTYNGSGITTDSNYTLYVNDVLQTLTGSAETPPTNLNQISGIVSWKGTIAQVMLWPFVFTAGNRTQQAAANLAKWGL